MLKNEEVIKVLKLRLRNEGKALLTGAEFTDKEQEALTSAIETLRCIDVGSIAGIIDGCPGSTMYKAQSIVSYLQGAK